ncbi:MAG: class I SAM-dependent methyltransferase [Bauldia sp.]|nr:class I SAM-dependent methyltransferase [Bauldia sp.]
MSRFESTLIDCPLCGAHADRHEVVSQTDRRGRPLRSVVCTACGLVFSNPMPVAAALDDFYTRDYRREYQKAITPKPRHIIRAFRVAKRRLEGLQPYLPKTGRILDLGAGGGEWVHSLATAGYAAEGVEPNVGFARYAISEYGHPIAVAPLEAATVEPGSYDAVTAFHVLEHLRDPGAALDRVHALLTPKGKLIVEVPDITARDQSTATKFHPAHVVGFTAETLGALARRHGFTIDADLTGRLNGENVALVLLRNATPVPGAMPPAKTVPRVKAALARQSRFHRRTLPNAVAKAWRAGAERLATRGMSGRRIAEKVLGPAGGG